MVEILSKAVRGSRIRHAVRAGIAIGALFIASQAGAAIVESLTSRTHYSLSFNVNGSGGQYGISGNQDTGSFTNASPSGIPPALATGNFQSTFSSGGAFDYLHDATCTGYCTAQLTTTITDIITNTGDTAVDVWFHTLITPGMIGLQGIDGSTGGNFFFGIANIDADGSATNYYGLYQAIGSNPQFSQDGPTTATAHDGGLSNYTVHESDNQIIYDWSATNVAVNLGTFAPGEERTIQVFSLATAYSGAVCTDLEICDSVRVVFGDPRNDGNASRGVPGAVADISLLGREFGAYESYLPQATTDATPIAEEPAPLAPVSYAAAPDFPAQSDVPEPASWAMFIGGFGLVGSALRRKREKLAAT